MKFEVNSIKISTLISQVLKARNKDSVNTYLNNVYINNEDNNLTIRATNLEITCEKTIQVKGVLNGKCLINGDILFKLANTLLNIDTNITFELEDDNILNINYLKNNIKLKTTKIDGFFVDDFPNLPKKGKEITKIKIDSYINLIKSVAFCASTTEIIPTLASIYLYSLNNELYSVATDSFRLVQKKIQFKIENDFSILISQKNINEKISILENLKEEYGNNYEITLYNNDNLLTVEIENTIIVIRSISGSFPDYKQLFPKEFKTKIEINKNELKTSLNLSTIFVDSYSYIEMDINTEEKTIKFNSKNDKIGILNREINPKNIEGDNIKVSYNSNYFLEGISNIDNENIELLLTESNRPLFIKNPKDESFVYLLMPLNK